MGEVEHWTTSIAFFRNASILPQTYLGAPLDLDGTAKVSRVYNHGVYTSDGRIVPEAIHISGSHRHVPDDWTGSQEGSFYLPGRWLYGGILRGHFGHFMVESIGRLWGLDRAADDVEGIVFVNLAGIPRVPSGFSHLELRKAEALVSRRKYIREALTLLAPAQKIHVVTQPTKVSELIVPTQLMGNLGERHFIGGEPSLQDYVKRILSGIAPAGARRLYVSRSRLPPGSSSFLFESAFEDHLRAEGYEVIYPESLTLAKQIAAYKAAEEIIVATGSAVHLLALALTGTQRIALMDREFAAPAKFAAQLEGMGARSVHRINAVAGRIRPTLPADRMKIRWTLQNAAYIVDFERLWEELRELGFVSGSTSLGETARRELPGQVAEWAARRDDIAVEVEMAPALNRDKPLPTARIVRRPQSRPAFPGHLDALRQGLSDV